MFKNFNPWGIFPALVYLAFWCYIGMFVWWLAFDTFPTFRNQIYIILAFLVVGIIVEICLEIWTRYKHIIASVIAILYTALIGLALSSVFAPSYLKAFDAWLSTF